MSREYRPVPDERKTEFRSLIRYAFRLTSGRGEPDEEDVEAPRNQFGERRAMVVDADDGFRTVCKHIYFTARVRGETHPMAGLSAVATPPEHRRQGFVRDLLVESLAEYRERDVPLSALWPFERSFYAKFGWATANRYHETSCPPSDLAGVRPDDAGRFRPVDPDDEADLEVLDDLYAGHARRFGLSIERSPEWWRHRVLTGWDDDPFAYVYERDGEPRGYLVYDVSTEDVDGGELRVWDHAWRTPADFRHLLGFLANHDSQVERVSVREAGGTDLLDVVERPGDTTSEVKTGPMVRLVDVPTGIERLAPADAGDGAVVCGVSDPLVDANADTFRLSLGGEGVGVERTDADPDVSLGVGALSQLVVGSRSLSALARTGAATVNDETAAGRLAAAFPATPTFLRDFF